MSQVSRLNVYFIHNNDIQYQISCVCHVFDSDGQAPVNDLAPYVLNTNFQNFSLPDEEEIADEGAIARLFGRFFERNVKNRFH